jgi:hypothetical protein
MTRILPCSKCNTGSLPDLFINREPNQVWLQCRSCGYEGLRFRDSCSDSPVSEVDTLIDLWNKAQRVMIRVARWE